MQSQHLKRGLWFIALVLVQALVLNHVHIAGYATPFAYVYFILSLKCNTPRNVLLLWGFTLGLVVDIFSDTPGMNAAATTLLAFVRPWLINLFMSHDNTGEESPGKQAMGLTSFLGYAVVGILIHHIALLLLDAFSFFNWGMLLLKTLCSTALTTICVLVMDTMQKQR